MPEVILSHFRFFKSLVMALESIKFPFVAGTGIMYKGYDIDLPLVEFGDMKGYTIRIYKNGKYIAGIKGYVPEYEIAKAEALRMIDSGVENIENKFGLSGISDECDCFMGVDILDENELKDIDEEIEGLGTTKKTSNPYDIILYMFLDALQKDGKKWVQSWAVGKHVEPMNYISKRQYRGINSWILGMFLFKNKENNPFFLTRKQIIKLGGKIKKDAKPLPLFFWSNKGKGKKKIKVWESDGKPVYADENRTNDSKVTKEIDINYSFLKYYHTYHASQITGIKWKGLEAYLPEEFTEKETIETAEAIVKAMPQRPKIVNEDLASAFYRPSNDTVNMPLLRQFRKEQEYYSTLFHELIHSTAHQKRIGREMGGRFGDKKYAFEELIAEIGGAYLCGEAGILNFTFENSTAYLKGWESNLKKMVKEDKNFIIRAAKQAETASEYILGRLNIANKKPHKKLTPMQKKRELEIIGEYLSLHNKVKPLTYIEDFIGEIHKSISSGKIKKGSPLGKEINHIQTKLVKLYDNYPGDVHEKVKFNLDPKDIKHMQEVLMDAPAMLNGVKKKSSKASQIEVRKNKEKEGIEIVFPDKPNPKIRESLRNKGFKWSNENKLWYCKYTENNWRWANSFTSDIKDINEPEKELGSLDSPVKPCLNKKSKELVRLSGSHKGIGEISPAPDNSNEKKAVAPVNAIPDKPTAPVKSTCEEDDDEFGFIRADKDKIVKAANVTRLPGEIGKLLQDQQPYKLLIEIIGDPHAGKTEFVTQLMDAFADDNKKIAGFFLEQGGMESKDTRAALDRNVKPKNKEKMFITSTAKYGLDTIKKAASMFDVIIIDSWQKLKQPNTVMDDLRHQFPNTIFLIIFQQNSEGKTRGGISADYDAPVKLKVHKVDSTFVNNYVEIEKNRGNSLNWHYVISEKKTYPGNRPEPKKEEPEEAKSE